MASPIMIPITFFILKLSWLFVLLKSRGFLIFVLANQASNSSHVQSTRQRYNKNEILPHLSVAKRGYICQSRLSEVVPYILYKLKTGCQWYMLPVSSFFTAKVLHYKIVYGHFRKWCKKGEWQKVWTILLGRYKSFLDMSSIDLDGNHTTAL